MSRARSVCLIGGSGRSGTTILREIFAKHPDVVTVGEMRFLTDPDGVLDFFGTFISSWDPYLYDLRVRRLIVLLQAIGRRRPFMRKVWLRINNRLGMSKRFPFIFVPRYVDVCLVDDCPDYFKLVDQLAHKLIDFTYSGRWIGSQLLERNALIYRASLSKAELTEIFAGFVMAVVESVGKKRGATHFIDDTPWNFLHFRRIFELLPEARLVHIYRDPRDVVASFTHQRWSPSDPTHAALWYKGIMQRWCTVRESLPSGSFLEVSLENLVSNPRPMLEGICAFWGIRWNDVLLETDLRHAHSRRWKVDFTSSEQADVTRIVESQLRALGYDGISSME